MANIPQTEPTVLLQCEVPTSLIRRVRIAAAKRNSRALRPVVVDALEAYLPPDDDDDSDDPDTA